MSPTLVPFHRSRPHWLVEAPQLHLAAVLELEVLARHRLSHHVPDEDAVGIRFRLSHHVPDEDAVDIRFRLSLALDGRTKESKRKIGL